MSLENTIHSSAHIGSNVQLGTGNVIGANVSIIGDVSLGVVYLPNQEISPLCHHIFMPADSGAALSIDAAYPR